MWGRLAAEMNLILCDAAAGLHRSADQGLQLIT
jgi:hypothetical protein